MTFSNLWELNVSIVTNHPFYKSICKIVYFQLGIETIFTRQASFPRLIRGAHVQDRLLLSDFEQSSGIILHETGSTVHSAYAKTLIEKFGDDIEFDANHPFIFTVEDETTGTLLFTGKFIRPQWVHYNTIYLHNLLEWRNTRMNLLIV